jgi:hypothetical protein
MQVSFFYEQLILRKYFKLFYLLENLEHFLLGGNSVSLGGNIRLAEIISSTSISVLCFSLNNLKTLFYVKE